MAHTPAETRAILRTEVEAVLSNPNIPNEVKVQFQNYAGCLHASLGLVDMTLKHNAQGTVSPLARMNVDLSNM
jgi:hypothetical protein